MATYVVSFFRFNTGIFGICCCDFILSIATPCCMAASVNCGVSWAMAPLESKTPNVIESAMANFFILFCEKLVCDNGRVAL